MSTFIERIRALFSQTQPVEKPAAETHAHAAASTALDEADMRNLMTALSMTRDDELSCAEVYALLDEYADHEVNDEDAAALMPLVEHHLQMCKDCCDQHDALLRVLEVDQT